MNTATITPTIGSTVHAEKNIPAKKDFWANLEYNRYGFITMSLTIVGTMGGIAAAFALGYSTVAVGVIAFASMLALSMVLAVTPMKAVVGTAALAVLADLIIIVLALLT